MNKQKARLMALRGPALTIIAMLATVVVGAVAFTKYPGRPGLTGVSGGVDHDDHACEGDDAHAGHDHGAVGHATEDSIGLSEQARKNLRLTTHVAKAAPFVEYIEIPGVVTDWPGRTHLAITSPLTGVISAIEISRGELVSSGTPLFTLRLTHQDLVETQEQFLTALGQLDIEQREIDRLASIASSGAIAGKQRIEREYERDKLQASLRAARQSMLLHGLTEAQIEHIETARELIREVTVYAPTLHSDRSLHHDSIHPGDAAATEPQRNARFASLSQPPPAHPAHIDADFLVTELLVSRGESVEAGQKLGQLSDYSTLLIEGSAFQRDSEALRSAADGDAPLQAVTQLGRLDRHIIEGLKIVYLGNEVDRKSRALPFYVELPNETERSETVDAQRYVSWRYKPGQRMTLRLPTESLDNAIVLPKEAVVEEGPERYVFIENNDHFDRVAVHVLANDSLHVAIANDGQVWPGQTIAVRGAHQLQMALKNQSGGAIDPHAGHNH